MSKNLVARTENQSSVNWKHGTKEKTGPLKRVNIQSVITTLHYAK